MCNVCNKPESKFSMLGLSGKMCSACHDAVLQARKGNIATAKEYFNNISFISEDARRFIQNELQNLGTESVPDNQINISKATSDSTSTESIVAPTVYANSLSDINSTLCKISNDICTIKNILIFFLIITIIGLGGTLLYVVQFVNEFKHFL